MVDVLVSGRLRKIVLDGAWLTCCLTRIHLAFPPCKCLSRYRGHVVVPWIGGLLFLRGATCVSVSYIRLAWSERRRSLIFFLVALSSTHCVYVQRGSCRLPSDLLLLW